jgi:hypothetical protein
MANPRIEVEIGANVAGLTAGVNTATGQLDKLGKAAQTTAPQVQRLAQATQGYNSVGVDFARIIQDAPFGIIGVGNNITQLAGSFQVLKNQTGSTSGALKSALGSILSSGNALVLGISILTTVFTILQQKGFFKTEEAAKSLRERLDEFKESLDGVKKATLEGQIAAQKEISTYKLLQVQAENTSLSQEKRNEAVRQLQKQYPEYLKGLTEEQIKTGQVGEAYNKLTNDIVALSKAKAFSAQIDKNTADSLTLLLQEEERAILISQKRQDQERARREDEQRRAFGTAGGAAGAAAISEAASIENEINSLIQETVKSSQERVRLSKEIIRLEAGILDFSSQGANFVKQTGTAIDANKEKLEKYSDAWDEYNLQQEVAKNLQDKLTFSAKDYENQIIKVLKTSKEPIIPQVTGDNAWDQYTFSVYQFEKAAFEANKEITETSKNALEFGERIKSLEGKEVKIDVKVEGLESDTAAPPPFIQQLETALNPKKFTEFEKRIADFAFNVRDLLQNNLTNAFVDLGYTIGESLASGANVIQEVGKSLLKSFGRFLGQFGEQLIAYGVATIAFGKASIGLSNPFTAIPSGGLAIAAGVALTAISGIIGSIGKKGMGGGGGGGGGGAGGGSAAPAGSTFTGGGVGGLFAQNRDLNGELVVRGQDLVYVFGQANDRINKG